MTTMHLLARGDALTECGQGRARSDELTTDPSKMTCPDCRRAYINQGTCPECGSDALTWTVDIMLVDCFNLGCEGCSTTLISDVSAARVADFLNDERWRP